MEIFSKIFKSYSEKEVKRIMPIVEQINGLEDNISKLSDEQLKNKTNEFKKQLEEGKTLDDILPEAFAVVREASKRVLGMRHFDVQLIGGIILHQGRIAEMKTGEGKTLVATLPVYLNALTGKGVHVITVNDYLAKRDSEWMGKLYKFLGLSVGLVIAGMEPKEKRQAYASDITYGTNNEFGFDYLRDNMVIYQNQLVQRGLNYAIVDEIDSILIDEARTPLIISGRANQSSDMYKKANDFVRRLKAKIIVEEDVKDKEQADDNENYDYIVDLKAKSASLTQKGIKKAEDEFRLENFNDIENSTLVHHVNQALRAHGIMKRDIDYIVKDGEVLIVDEFTGRIMYGRRYNNGLHQAIEAKEGVKIADESKTLATITFQNYFRMYNKLSGMTGTAMTEEAEFEEIYNLDVISIPTNKPMLRKDQNDVIYKNENAKFNAIVQSIKESHEKGQPVLVGTVSIEKSEKLSRILSREGIKHEVLNAKFHEKEAEIIAQAGKYGAVTIATNMAGRGTDIMLGGNSEYLAKQEMKRNKIPDELIEQANTFYETDDKEILNAREQFKKFEKKFDEEIKEEKEKVLAVGGLKIIGTERHESRRIDNQLRGRSGRQGDPGESKFYIGLDDDLMKIFGGDIITKAYNVMGMDENIPIENKMISNAVESAQKKVEGRNFSIRKNVLKYDDVMNAQREIIYKQRRQVLDGENLKDSILNMINSLAEEIVIPYFDENNKVNVEALDTEVKNVYGIKIIEQLKEKEDANSIIEKLQELAQTKYAEKEKEIGNEQLRELERVVMLKVVDQKWMDHIDSMDELKNGIGLRAYGQQDPVVKYRIEGMDMFEEMVYSIKYDVVKILMNIRKQEEVKREEAAKITSAALQNLQSLDNDQKQVKSTINKTVVKQGPQVGRNDPCICRKREKIQKLLWKKSVIANYRNVIKRKVTKMETIQEIEKQKQYIEKIKERNKEKKLKYYILTMGCQLNENDSEKLCGMMEQMGYDQTEQYQEADIVLFNTCCVRENAEDKLFGKLGELKRIKEQKGTIIAIGGCMMQEKHITDKIHESYPYTDIIFGTHTLHKFPEDLYKILESKKKMQDVIDIDGEVYEGLPIKRTSNIKASVTIMYGCNNFCTYCIVPYVRGRERSRHPKDILAEVEQLAKEGYKEITLLGQNVNSYLRAEKWKENNIDYNEINSFATLLRAINKIEGIERIRFVSPHPKDFTDDVIEAIADCDKVCKLVHLPLQSGSTNVLKAMNRKYSKEQYLNLVEKMKSKIPNLTLSTDIIVGFAGETEADFEDTLDVVKKVKFEQVYMFIYSRRVGTPGDKMENQIPDKIKHERFDKLKELVENQIVENNQKYVGTIQKVLVEGPSKNNQELLTGRTDSNKVVIFEGETKLKNEIIKLKIISEHIWYLRGEKIDE